MASISPELTRLLESVEIVTPTRVRVGDRLREVSGPSPVFVPDHTPSDPAATLEEALWRALVEELYCWSYARARAAAPAPPDPDRHRDHLVALSRANRSSATWEPGWRVRALDDGGRVAVEGYGLVFVATVEEVRPEAGELVPGAPCRVRILSEMSALNTGFYTITGETAPAPPATLTHRVRLYWNLRAEGAPAWAETVTRGFDQREIPFQLKLVTEPRFYLRADAGVLALEPSYYDAAQGVIQAAYERTAADLRPEVPGLTRQLAPGVGVAEGAADGGSFGAHRCRLIASALVRLGPGRGDLAARAEAVAAAFRAARLDPLHPHRASGSSRRYAELDPPALAPAPAPAQPAPATAGTPAAPDPLAAATEIGDELVATAVRGDERANWLGRLYVTDPESGATTTAFGALGPGLYAGSAGIALFLAELFRHSGAERHRATALAAIRQALGVVAREPGLIRPVAFFEGQLGIAWAAQRTALAVEDEETADQAHDLLDRIVRELPGERGSDLIDGNAGAILALLRLHEESGDAELIEAARRLGEELLLEDPRSGPWAGAGRPALTGLSHGAAGVGLALLELSEATGEERFRAAADGCFAYEEALFDPARGNWPDYRMVPCDETGRPLTAPGYALAWCHGAPGIALSRLRAMEVDTSRAALYEPAARAGLATTAAALDQALAAVEAETCLCHGVAGLAEILRIGADALGESRLARQASEATAALGGARARADRVLDPSLLTGDAGVGYALLRLHDPERLATVLLPAARPVSDHRSPRPAGGRRRHRPRPPRSQAESRPA